jgi:hypothetical protein
MQRRCALRAVCFGSRNIIPRSFIGAGHDTVERHEDKVHWALPETRWGRMTGARALGFILTLLIGFVLTVPRRQSGE